MKAVVTLSLIIVLGISSAAYGQFKSGAEQPSEEPAVVLSKKDFLSSSTFMFDKEGFQTTSFKQVTPRLRKSLKVTGRILDGLLNNDPFDRFDAVMPYTMRAFRTETASEYQNIYNTYRLFITN